MSADDTPLASLSLTHVYYDPDDHVSLACAWLALLPQALCVVYVTLILTTREAEILLMFAGQMACEAVNFGLKRLIKEQRPPRFHGRGYGMPSSHAQFASFWAVSLTLFLLLRHRPRYTSIFAPSSSSLSESTSPAGAASAQRPGPLTRKRTRSGTGQYHRPHTFFERSLASAGGIVLAALVAWSRVYLNYHTTRQVFVGMAAGTLCAAGWYGAVSVVRRSGLLERVLDLPLARWMRARDLLVQEDMCQAGWEKWEEQKAVARATKQR